MTKHVNNAYVLNRVNAVKQRAEHAVNKVSQAGRQTSFNEILERVAKNDIKVTKHAQLRLQSRELQLSESEIEKVAQAMDDAAQKGVKEAVIVIDERLLVASVANRTIITAANKTDIQAKIITKIDGAIFI